MPETPQHFLTNRVSDDMALAVSLEQDAQLMMQVRTGDTACFAQLLERHRTPVIHFLYRMIQNQSVAEELAQEVFLRVYRSRESYEPTAKFTTWLYRIATHLALNYLRDHRRERAEQSIDVEVGDSPTRELTDRQSTVEQELVRQATLNEVRQAIERLPDKQRAAVLMHKYEELEYSNIARVLQCSESAVKSLLFRAYETLRARLAHMA